MLYDAARLGLMVLAFPGGYALAALIYRQEKIHSAVISFTRLRRECSQSSIRRVPIMRPPASGRMGANHPGLPEGWIMTQKPISLEPLGTDWEEGGQGREPPLCEVLADPIIQAIMRCDGVSPAALGSLIADARQRHKSPIQNSGRGAAT